MPDSGLDFPYATQAMRIRRDGYAITSAAISKQIVHAITSLARSRQPG